MLGHSTDELAISRKPVGARIIIYYNGESDPSVSSGSSVLCRDAVSRMMNPGISFNESCAALNKRYRFFLISGAGQALCNETYRRLLAGHVSSHINIAEVSFRASKAVDQ